MDESIFREIGILNNMLVQYINENGMLVKEGEDITKTEGFVINFICNNYDKDIYQKDIEKVLQVRKSTVTVLLDKMERKGMIERHIVATDRRLKRIVPTAMALARHSNIKAAFEDVENRCVDGLSREETEQFTRTIKKIQENLLNKGE